MKALPRRRVLIALLLSAAVVFSVQAQAPAPSFEVASIRLVEHHSLDDLKRGIGVGEFNSWPSNRFFAHYMPLGVVISMAFKADHFDGGPDWLGSQLYSIDAKVEGEHQLTIDEMRPLVQDLLVQRFHFKLHHERRIESGYALVVGKNGPKLQLAKNDKKRKYWFQILPNEMEGWGAPAGTLASMLAGPAGKPVVDKTGLTGSYDITLKYAAPNNPNADSTLPDIFTAVQEQLGLKLIPAKVPVDYLVIDHVDRVPTEN